jgi:hypothetical protein
MSGRAGEIITDIVEDGLVFNMDAANRACYSRTGTTTTDTIENVSGTLQGGTTFSTDGVGSFYYGGGDEYISLTTSLLTHVSNVSQFTIGQWAKPKNGTDFMTLGHVDSHPAGRLNFGTWNNGNIIYNIGQSGGAIGQAIYKAYSNWDNWSYWVCTFDKSLGSKAERLRGYIDGVDPGGWTDYGADGSYNTGTVTNFDLGYVGAWSSYSYGSQGPVHIYNRALSASEVLHNYNALKERFGL